MIEFPITLTSGGSVCLPGRAFALALGYTKNRGVYRLHVDATGEWEGLTIRCFWHVPDGKNPASSLVVDGYVAVPASVTAQPGSGCVTFEGSDGTKTVTSADLRYRVSANSGTEDGTEPEPGTPAWQQLVDAVHTDAAAAEQAKTDAQTAAQQADTSASAASTSAANAGQSAQQAADNLQELKDGIANGDFKGEKGDPGPIGPVGPQGAQGPQGEKGDTGPAVALDPTLSLSGKAADAKATGDAVQSVMDDLASEVSRAETAEKANADNIATEVERAQAAESALSTKITEETERAKAAEQANADGIGQLKEDISNEKIARENADTAIQDAITAITSDDTAVNGQPWTSRKIVDSLCQPFEESGNPVQCYPVENYPLGVKVSWEPVQEGSGTPSPDNIRPIKGRANVMVERCGENLLDVAQCRPALPGAAYGLTVTVDDTGLIRVFGTPKVMVDFPSAIFRILFSDQVTLAKLTKYNAKWFVVKGVVDVITVIQNDKSIVLKSPLSPNTPVDIQFRLMYYTGTTAPTTYKPYIGQTNTMNLPETVYGGELDLETGVVNTTWGHIASYAGEALPGEWISDRDVYSSGAVPTTGAQVVYKLTEPITIQLTPQQIAALSGVNTIYTNADGVIVTGAEDPKHTITELKNAIISLGGNI